LTPQLPVSHLPKLISWRFRSLSTLGWIKQSFCNLALARAQEKRQRPNRLNLRLLAEALFRVAHFLRP
jgi:hypothetical protein